MRAPHPKIMEFLGKARFLPYRWRRSCLKRLYPSLLQSHSFTTTIEGGARCTGNLVNYIDRLIFFCGAHEKYMLHFLRDCLPMVRAHRSYPVTFMDIGANIGNHSLYMARLVDTVYAFEPFPAVRERFMQHLAQNALSNVRVFPFALGDANAHLPFFAGDESSLGTASFCADHHAHNRASTSLEVRMGDEVVAAEKLGRIDLIKLDVEGFEPPVLRGLRATLERDRPLAIVEITPTTRTQLGDEAALYALFPKDYVFFAFAKASLDSGRYRLEPFDYSKPYKIEDIIACPAELAGFMPMRSSIF